MSGLYNGLGGGGDSGIEFAWRDVLMNALLAIVILLVLLLFLVNPPTEEEQSNVDAPGNLIVELTWDSQRDVDLDLWVQAPGDKPVGYSNKQGKIFNLLRDDLGKRNDVTDVNLENAYTRGIVAGEYTVNVHYFGSADGGAPLDAKVVVRLSKGPGLPAEQLLYTTVTMRSYGQELTAFRFKLTKDGDLVPGSVHHVFKPLRSQGGARRAVETRLPMLG